MTLSARLFIAVFCLSPAVAGLAQESSDSDSSVRYPANYFAEFTPLTVNDMLDRVPGIDLILNNRGANADGDRGLGASANILIDGKRLAGKANEARAQLDRISADQVDYIQIVRGTSAELDVQNTGQLVNIVLMEAQSRSSLSSELSARHFEDGTIEPGLSLAWNGQSGGLSYLFSGQIESAYEHSYSLEQAVNGDFSPREVIAFDRYTEQTDYSLNTNLAWTLGNGDRLALNALYNKNDPPSHLLRSLTSFDAGSSSTRYERESVPATASDWELGADYEHGFNNGNRFKALLIVNEEKSASTRERFRSASIGGTETKDLYLDTTSRYRERIARSSYTMNLNEGQGLELGAEVAQTIQDNSLKLGVLTPNPGSPEFGGLTPVNFGNANSSVEEFRVEPFAIHNWQINPRMSLESSLVGEYSEIEQSGDLSVKRDFSFIKPKFDWRFDLSNSLQVRATLEKFVSQLSFADFSRSSNDEDDEENTKAGNPTLEPEESIRFELGLDWRLPNDGGALNTRYFHYRWDNKIGGIDISTEDFLDTTNGNIGRADAYGVQVNASLRLGMLGLDNALVTGSLTVQDSDIEVDPFTNRDAHFFPYDRGGYRLGFRQDFPSRNINWGINFNERIDGNRIRFDIDNKFELAVPNNLTAFVEMVGWFDLTYRLEGSNLKDAGRCYNRFRYAGDRRIAPLSEVENICSSTGPEYAISVQGNF
ncbi:MAG: outer membrane beta-barrel protein [Pseudomonadales bacterium]|nr:outer membrane beta-barrel protein [Pseudomonadales bacterium]